MNSSQSRLINVGAQDDKRRQLSQALGTAILDNELFVELCNQAMVLLMDKILHDPKDPKLWELWYIPYNG